MSDVLKILSIGNSFSQDSHAYLHNILLSAGVDNLCFDLIIGGCTLETHAANIKDNGKKYVLGINAVESKELVSIGDVIGLYEWDVLTNQQASVASGKPETFEPYLNEVLSFCQQKCPGAKQYLQKTWAYEVDCPIAWFDSYDRNQDKMYKAITDTFDLYSKKYNVPLIPSGDVIHALRSTRYFNYPNGGISLHRDGFHMNIPYGRYALGLTWAKALANVDPLNVKYIPENADVEIIQFIRQFVHSYFENK